MARTDLRSCHLGSFTVGKLSLGEITQIPSLGSCHLGKIPRPYIWFISQTQVIPRCFFMYYHQISKHRSFHGVSLRVIASLVNIGHSMQCFFMCYHEISKHIGHSTVFLHVLSSD